jgi:hypothetical protein
MGRKRIELGAEAEAQIAARMKRGQSAQTIAKAIGGGVSYRTVARRMRELKGKEPPKESKPVVEDVADVPEEIPEGVDLGTVEKWIPRIERAAESAEADGDFTAMSSLMAKLVALLEHKRKATPIPKPDPNDNPDMIAAKERARKEFHRLIEHSLITRVRIA